MENSAVFIPVLAQFLLVLVLYIALSRTKTAAVRAKQVDLPDSKLNADAWPDAVRKINNNIANQYELPVLFYGLVFMVWALKLDDLPTLTLIWGFVLSRYLHAYVHTTSNYVPRRLKLFAVGLVIVLVIVLRVLFAIVFG